MALFDFAVCEITRKLTVILIDLSLCYLHKLLYIVIMKLIESSAPSFEEIITKDFLYVDKTEYLYNLITGPKMTFFARPRRFGKSMTVKTLKAIFQGKKELFKDLAIYNKPYDWKAYPVIHIDFGSCGFNTPSKLEDWLCEKVLDCANKNNINLETFNKTSFVLFENLILKLASNVGKVVVLIDEYDKVLSDNIEQNNINELIDVLGNFYQVIKTQDENIHFAFITGVTKFAKLSVFSKMNNLEDYSMDKKFACMCGYTQAELEHYFSEYIDESLKTTALSRDVYLSKLKSQYDGYKFHHQSESVYNPISIGKFFLKGGEEFEDYWIDTGNMKLLMDLAKRVNFAIFKDTIEPITKSELKTFEITALKNNVTDKVLKSLLLQTGYLTINRAEDNGQLLYLKFPNLEVVQGFCLNLLTCYFTDQSNFKESSSKLRMAFNAGRVEEAMNILKSVFASIPYNIQPKEKRNKKQTTTTAPTEKEAYYHSILYVMLLSLGADIRAEVANNQGRMDAVLVCLNYVYVIECKIDQSADVALKQIDTKEYAQQFVYNSEGKIVHKLGINFNTKLRNIDDWKLA